MPDQNQDSKRGRLEQFWSDWWGCLVVVPAFLTLVILFAVMVWTDQLETGFGQYPRRTPDITGVKTLGDWMELLLVPLVLASSATLFTWLMTKRERKTGERPAEADRDTEEQRAKADQEFDGRRAQVDWRDRLDRSCEAALQAYLDHMTDLLKEGLRESNPNDSQRSIAQARTQAVLRQLDGKRRGPLLRFLFKSGLIEKEAIIDLSKAELIGAALRGATLQGANLSMANLQDANLSNALLSGADLSWADLRGGDLHSTNLEGASLRGAFLFGADLSAADLRGTDLRWANLHGADLRGTDLQGADLHWANLEAADLTGAKVTDEQLAQAKSVEVATMPDGTRHG
jgi:hypothetical protein